MSNTPSAPSSGAPTTPAPIASTEVTPANVNPASEVAEGATEAAESTSPQEAPKQPSKEEIKEAIKKWKLKSQGKEREITSEDELVRLAQLGLGAHEKFEQAAKTRKQTEALVELLQKDPTKALASMGHDMRKLAEQFIMEEAQKQMMSPEERQKAEIQAEIQRLRQEKEDLVKQKREEQIQQLQTKYEADIQDQIIGAIDKYKLPKNPKTVARMAEYMATALEHGYEVTAADVAPRVRSDLEDEHKSLFAHYDVEELLKVLGEDQLKKIRQYEVNKVKAKAPAAPIKTEPVVQPKAEEADEKPKKKMTMDELQDELFNKYLK